MSVEYTDKTILVGNGSFMTVRHLILRGSQQEIGHRLAVLARDELSVRKVPWTDPLMTRAQRTFMERNWPAHFARMRGVAEAFGRDLADDSVDLSFLAYDTGIPGCSCVYYPGGVTADGHNILSRNFDYTTGSYTDLPVGFGIFDHLAEEAGAAATRPYVGRPFLLETHPDDGYATLGMCAFDLLGSMTDGINSQGLAVALLNDSETINGPLLEPFGKNGVGLSESQIPRFLLETCANADEAVIALLTTKQYYNAGPCHYLIGDRSGRAFVWEFSSIRNRHHIIECGGKPLAVTNHLLHSTAAEKMDMLKNSLGRFARLKQEIAQTSGKFTKDSIRRINRCVQACDEIGKGQYVSVTHPARTLWYAYYDLDALSVEFDFFLGETDGKFTRSSTHSFRLEQVLS